MKRTGKWLILLCAALLLLLVICCSDGLMLHLAPKMVLKEALPETLDRLQNHFSHGPLGIMAKTLEIDGKYTVDGMLELSGTFGEPIRITGTLQTDIRDHQFRYNGSAAASRKALELSVYMDGDYLAVASEDLTEGGYYGITYDTFPEDIRTIPLVTAFIGDSVFSGWERAIEQLQAQIRKTKPLPYLPEVSEEAGEGMFLGLLALPCEAEDRTILLENTTVKCRCLTYPLSRNVLKEFCPFLTETPESAEISFYLSGESLVCIQCKLADGKGSQWTLLPNSDGQTPLLVQYVAADQPLLTVSVTTTQKNGYFRQKWEIRQAGEGTAITCDWEEATGKLTLCWKEETLSSVLTEIQGGFHFETEELNVLWNSAGFSETAWQPVSCSLSITKGSSILKPEYQNLDSWSLEDFLVLAEGIGTWIGLHFD